MTNKEKLAQIFPEGIEWSKDWLESKYYESTSEIPNKCDVIPGRCKDCKYFEYDSVADVNGVPLIVAHEICKRWGDGCKSNENGFCFLFERKDQRKGEE